jgi:hypothetical protein
LTVPFYGANVHPADIEEIINAEGVPAQPAEQAKA